jgi:hypothetical protein
LSSQPSTIGERADVAETSRPTVVGTRVDAAHVQQRTAGDIESPPHTEASGVPESPPDCFVADSTAQLTLHAQQLAERLRQGQEELIGREGMLNVQRAQFDNELRAARLWLDERCEELEDHQQRLDERLAAAAGREAELERRESIVTAREEELEWRRARAADSEGAVQTGRRQLEFERQVWREQLDRQRGELNDEAARLAQQASELAATEAALAGQAANAGLADTEHSRALDERMARLGQRETAVEAAEKLLAEGRSHVARLRESLVQRHEQLEVQARADRERLAHEQRRCRADWSARRRDLARHAEQLGERRHALERSRTALGRLYRETLELRLAGESPYQLAAANESSVGGLGELKRRLADECRIEAAELAARLAELGGLRTQLIADADCLRDRQLQMAVWAEQRKAELDENAERLALRQRELDEQSQLLVEQEEGWLDQRLALLDEIRRLRGFAG